MIKITPFGYETLNNSRDWSSYKSDGKYFGNSATEKIRIMVPTDTF